MSLDDPAVASSEEMPAWQRERRSRIVRAALELLEHGDYESVQMRDVAIQSGFALGTIYRYFKSKEHLYAAVMVEWSRSFQRHLRQKPLTRASGPDQLKEIVRRVIKAFQRRPQFLRLEHLLENSTDEHARGVFKEAGNWNHASFREAIPDVPDDVAGQIVLVVTNVLGNQLNQYALGHVTLHEVEHIALGAVDLIFSSPPWHSSETSGVTGPPT